MHWSSSGYLWGGMEGGQVSGSPRMDHGEPLTPLPQASSSGLHLLTCVASFWHIFAIAWICCNVSVKGGETQLHNVRIQRNRWRSAAGHSRQSNANWWLLMASRWPVMSMRRLFITTNSHPWPFNCNWTKLPLIGIHCTRQFYRATHCHELQLNSY